MRIAVFHRHECFSFWLGTAVSMSFPLPSRLIIANIIMDKQEIIDRRVSSVAQENCVQLIEYYDLHHHHHRQYHQHSSPFFSSFPLYDRPTGMMDTISECWQQQVSTNYTTISVILHLKTICVSSHRQTPQWCGACVLSAEWDSPCHVSCNTRIHASTKNDKQTGGKSERCYACINTRYNCRFRFSLDLYVTWLFCFFAPLVLCFHFYVCRKSF